MVDNLERRGGADRIQFRRYTPDPSIEGRLLSDLAREQRRDAIDVAIGLIEGGNASIVSFNMDDGDVETLMAQPWTMTSSDGDLVPWMEGVPHPRSYGTFPRKIRLYVQEKGVLPLEAAVRSMTSLPALVWGLSDRGTLRAGAAADVVVFDLDRVNDPAEYTAPHKLAEGMVWVFVNGEATVREGAFTDARPGRVLQKGR
jgi:N-acyl-D-aspartate/D-glutamate deacylase